MPKNMVTGVRDNFKQTFNKDNLTRYLDPNATFGEIHSYTKSVVQTAATVYGGVKAVQGIATLSKNIYSAVNTTQTLKLPPASTFNISNISTNTAGMRTITGAKTYSGGLVNNTGIKAGTLNSLKNADLVRVGRWMSQTEYDKMALTGRVQESFSGTTSVANPANIESFAKQAKPGSIYAEFDMPINSLKPTSTGWSKVLGPNSLEGRHAAQLGIKPITKMPTATNIRIVGGK